MGLILIIVFMITAYGADLVLKRFMHDDDAVLQRTIDGLCADLAAQRARQAATDAEVALLCAAADASDQEFAALRSSGTTNGAANVVPNGKAGDVERVIEVCQPGREEREANSWRVSEAQGGGGSVGVRRLGTAMEVKFTGRDITDHRRSTRRARAVSRWLAWLSLLALVLARCLAQSLVGCNGAAQRE